MADPGFLSGFIGKGIDIAISQILHHAGIAFNCQKELKALEVLVRRIEPIATSIHQCRLELNRNRGTSTSTGDNTVSQWVKKLHGLLRQAMPLVQKCTIPSFNVFARYQMSRDISSLISDIKEHLEAVSVILLLEQQAEKCREMRRESAQASTSGSASTSQAPTGTFFIEEAVIVGQDQAFATLENFLIDAEVNTVFRTGVVGKGGSGKTLLLRRLFNGQKVRYLFRDDLLLWLTVSQSPSFSSLRNELCKQIAVQAKSDYDQNMNEEHVKRWLSERLQEKRFALFLDDVWGHGGELQDQLGLRSRSLHSNSKIIVSSRSGEALREMGVADTSALTMGDLSKEESWELFAHHAFPYNNGITPANMEERRAKVVCGKCGGLPLAIKVIGRSMAGISDPQRWELAALGLPNANIQDRQALNDRLRWSYDALGNTDVNLQLCFLYLAAFREDEIINVDRELIPLWLGEGLLERNQSGHDPYEMGRIYANILADRCLIEPLLTDVDGRVLRCRMHDILRGLAIEIGEQEEKLYCRAGNGLTDQLVENEYSECTRLFLNHNKLSSLPNSFTTPEIFSLLISHNNFTKIPRKAIGNMRSLKVLNLSYNRTMESLPKSLGSLKQLVSLDLRRMPIKRLPTALTNLASLQVLDLSHSKITELPFGIHKLTSLRRLDLYECDDLQCLPRSISRLTSLQCLNTMGCEKVWTKHGKKKAASVNDLASLRQLKKLSLWNRAETISEGTLGSMLQMETLLMKDDVMMSLPGDMTNLSKLKRLWLYCPEIVQIDGWFCEFQNLTRLHLWGCVKLEELPSLHKMKSLRELHVHQCSKLKKLPTEFGEKGAFPSLETFSLSELLKLEELPTIMVKEDVMPSLKIFTIMRCEGLKLLPENYLYFKSLQKIRVFGCSMLLENLENIKIETKVKVITMPLTKDIMDRYLQKMRSREGWLYSDFWCNELVLFLQELFVID